MLAMFATSKFADRAKTLVVVTEFETTRFAKGWVIALLEIFERKPPSP
jgi:hypothetical protein